MAAQMQWNEIIRSSLTAYVNHALTAGFLYLGQKLAFSPETLSAENIAILAGAIVAGVGSLAMRLYRQKKTHNLVEAAREAEPGTRFAAIQNEAAEKPIFSG